MNSPYGILLLTLFLCQCEKSNRSFWYDQLSYDQLAKIDHIGKSYYRQMFGNHEDILAAIQSQSESDFAAAIDDFDSIENINRRQSLKIFPDILTVSIQVSEFVAAEGFSPATENRFDSLLNSVYATTGLDDGVDPPENPLINPFPHFRVPKYQD